MNNQHINSWKTSNDIFVEQLQRNIHELDNNYPQHWKIFLNFLNKLNNKQVILYDIACGNGAIYELLRRHYPNITYFGFDYANHAIELAKKHWNYEKFYVKDYQDLTKDFCEECDILYSSALADVLPNGDECIDKLLSLGCKNVILQRLKISNGRSYYNQVTSYAGIDTYEYWHDPQVLNKIIENHDYDIDLMVDIEGTGRNFLLRKND
jgi:SAM-dependent methyltransferase